MKRSHFWILAIVAVLGASSLAAYSYVQKHSTLISPSPVLSPQYSSYTAPQYGYSFSYPAYPAVATVFDGKSDKFRMYGFQDATFVVVRPDKYLNIKDPNNYAKPDHLDNYTIVIKKSEFFSDLPESETISIIKKLSPDGAVVWLDGDRKYSVPTVSEFPIALIFTKNGVYEIAVNGDHPELATPKSMQAEIHNPDIENPEMLYLARNFPFLGEYLQEIISSFALTNS